jgi:predicted nicotinamide N-methyase
MSYILTGLPHIILSSLMVLTDLHEGTIANLQHNASLLPTSSSEVRVEPLSWGCDTHDVVYDVVMGSDLVYCEAIAPLLASTVAKLLNPGGYFLYTCPAVSGNGRAGLDRLELYKSCVVCIFKVHLQRFYLPQL